MRGPRGSRGGPRGGGMGGRGQGRGGPGGRGAAFAPRGGNKRKSPSDTSQGQSKKRNTDGNWGAQPIAQQPLGGDSSSQWYQDSYSQQW